MVKVTNHRHGVREVVATLNYLLPKSDRAEDDFGADVGTPESVVKDWQLQDEDGRSAAHVILSLPNQDPALEWKAARDAAHQLFANHPHVVALHTDTGNPHVHVVVRARDYLGRKIRINRETLHDYRQMLAMAGREYGIAVEARAYEVPTRCRDRWRVFSRKEPLRRTLDRHIAVLGRPAHARPSQLRNACKALGRHHRELNNGQRRQLLRAATTLEGYPTLAKVAGTLTRIAFQGPRGDRYKPRHEQDRDLALLARASRASEKSPSLKSSRGARPVKLPSARKRRRVLRRTLKNIGRLNQRQRDQLAASLEGLSARQQRKVQKALAKTKTPVERKREKVARKQYNVGAAMIALSKPLHANAIWFELLTLRLNRKYLQVGDRLKLRALTFEHLKDPEASARLRAQAQKLAKRPRTLGEHAAAAVRAVGAVALDQAEKALTPGDPARPHRERALDQAIERLADRDAGGMAQKKALWSLKRHKDELTGAQRERLQTLVNTRKQPDPSRPDLERHTPMTQAVTRVLAEPAPRPVDETRQFGPMQRQQRAIDRALQTLRTPPIERDWAARLAMFTLRRHREGLTLGHRAQLLASLKTWERKPDEHPALPRYIRAATQLIAHGEEGRAFVTRTRIAESLEILSRPTPRAEPAKTEPVKDALVTLQKDVIALRARERAQARQQAAAWAAEPGTAKAARKLARALDKTTTVEEHAQKHLQRALKTLANLPDAGLRARHHAKGALKKYHPFLTPKQARRLGDLADGLSARRPRLAKTLKRLARERSKERAPDRSR